MTMDMNPIDPARFSLAVLEGFAHYNEAGSLSIPLRTHRRMDQVTRENMRQDISDALDDWFAAGMPIEER